MRAFSADASGSAMPNSSPPPPTHDRVLGQRLGECLRADVRSDFADLGISPKPLKSLSVGPTSASQRPDDPVESPRACGWCPMRWGAASARPLRAVHGTTRSNRRSPAPPRGATDEKRRSPSGVVASGMPGKKHSAATFVRVTSSLSRPLTLLRRRSMCRRATPPLSAFSAPEIPASLPISNPRPGPLPPDRRPLRCCRWR